MQRLILRFGRDLDSPLQWLVYSDDAQEIIASGELSSAMELRSLQERADSAEVIALIPSSEVLLSSVSLPPNANRKVLSAIPYMLEEDVCGDIQQHFVALGKRFERFENKQQENAQPENAQQVAVVAKEKLAMWQHALSDAGIFCQTIIPDALALPFHENTISLVQLGDDLIARFSATEGLQGETDWLFDAINLKANAEELAITCYSEIDGLNDSQNGEEVQASDANESATLIKAKNINFDYSDLPLLLMLKNINSDTLNLCQGPYIVKRPGNPHWKKWKLAAMLAVVALTVNLVASSLELNQIKSQRSEINAQIASTINQSFPNIGQYRQARIAVEREMKRLEQTGGGLSMLAIMSQLSDAFASSGVTPQTLRYDASRTELRMQSVANNFESLERFRRDIQALGFEVDQGAINNQGDQVVGVVIVRG